PDPNSLARATSRPRPYEPDLGEPLGEQANVVAEVEERLPLRRRCDLAIGLVEPDPPPGEADGAGHRARVLKPVRVGIIVREHDRSGGAPSAVFLDHLFDEVRDCRLRVWRVKPHAAVPLMFEPVVVLGEVPRRADG